LCGYFFDIDLLDCLNRVEVALLVDCMVQLLSVLISFDRKSTTVVSSKCKKSHTTSDVFCHHRSRILKSFFSFVEKYATEKHIQKKVVCESENRHHTVYSMFVE
jgi:hypothetical protein